MSAGVRLSAGSLGGKVWRGYETNLPVSSKSRFHLSFMAASKTVMLSR